MEDLVMQQTGMSVTERNMLDYFKTHDVKYVTEDAVFKDMSMGNQYSGRAEIGALLHYLYHVAFDAFGDVQNYMIDEEHAMVEGYFTGRHIGEFAGIPATNREVKVPLCVTYTLQEGLIKEARIYMAANVLMAQLGVTG